MQTIFLQILLLSEVFLFKALPKKWPYPVTKTKINWKIQNIKEYRIPNINIDNSQAHKLSKYERRNTTMGVQRYGFQNLIFCPKCRPCELGQVKIEFLDCSRAQPLLHLFPVILVVTLHLTSGNGCQGRK